MKIKEEAPLNQHNSERANDMNDSKDTNFISILQQDIKSNQEKLRVNDNDNSGHLDHARILDLMIAQAAPVNFREEVGLEGENQNLARKHYLVTSIEQLLGLATENNWGICRNHDSVYIYNGVYWKQLESDVFENFLGEVTEKMGIDKYDARHYSFRQQLFKQFVALANLPKPEPKDDVVKINLKNGTLEIRNDSQALRQPDPLDFMTYVIPFDYDVEAQCPLFYKYLDTVMPDPDRQKILAEYLGYLFIKPSFLKLEKALLLYGSGANGKSVFFEIVNALLGGTENVSSYSLQSLTNESGYARAMLADKLVNYASEISGKLESSIFKQLVSGEPVEARLPYGNPFTLTDYAKLIFNVNELPQNIEHTPAFFRRLLIIPFEVTIPEEEQDKELAKKIIESELSGVLNWVLDGMRRLLVQRGFTYSNAVEIQIEQYKKQSDSVRIFLDDEGYVSSNIEFINYKILYSYYRNYCFESGYMAVSKKTFSDRLKAAGIVTERKRDGIIVYVHKD